MSSPLIGSVQAQTPTPYSNSIADAASPCQQNSPVAMETQQPNGYFSQGTPLNVKQEPLDEGYGDSVGNPGNGLHGNGNTTISQEEEVAVFPKRLGRPPMRGRRVGYTVTPVAPVDREVCEVCQGEFENYATFKAHKLAHFNTSRVCYICDGYFVNKDYMIVHMQTMHHAQKPPKTPRDQSFLCQICLQVFVSFKKMSAHQLKHAKVDATTFECKICSLDFIGNRALQSHLNSPRHKEMKVKLQSVFMCFDCRALFGSRDSYAMHMMLRAQGESCKGKPDEEEAEDSCASPALSSVSANASQSGYSMFSCTLCSERFEGQDALAMHMMTHASPTTTPNKPLDFTKYGQVKHEGHKFLSPFHCKVCMEVMPSQDALAMHMLGHAQNEDGEPVATAAGPSQRSIGYPEQQAQLNQTQRQNGNGSTHGTVQCEYCSETFQTKEALVLHEIGFHGQEVGNMVRLVPADMESIDMVTRCRSAPANLTEKGEQKCRVCEQIFANQEEFIDHVHTVHSKRRPSINSDITESRKRPRTADDPGNEVPMENVENAGSERIFCKVCNVSFPKSLFNYHLESPTHQENLIQKKCDSLVKKIIGSSAEGRSKTLEDPPAGDSTQTFEDYHDIKCDLCNMLFINQKSFKIHLKGGRHREMSQKLGRECCNMCGQTFGTINELVKHTQLMHSSQYTYFHKRTPPLPMVPVLGSVAVVSGVSSSSGNTMGRIATTAPSYPASYPHHLLSPLNLSKPLDIYTTREGSLSSNPSCASSSSVSGVQRSQQGSMGNSRPSSRSASGGIHDLQNDNQGHAAAADPDTQPIIEFAKQNEQNLMMCKHCNIIYLDKTVYYLHMGLHNLNDPWQCNLCGKVCKDLHEFSSHVIHY